MTVHSSLFIPFPPYLFLFISIWQFSQLVETQCITCNVSACTPWFLYHTYAGDAACVSGGPNDINAASGLILFESPTPQCSGNVLPWMCAGFRKTSEINQNASCPNPPLSYAKTCSSWCDKIVGCITSSFVAVQLACADTTRWGPTGQCNNVTTADVIRVAVPYQPTIIPQCPFATDTADAETELITSLGAMYTIYLNKSCPPIPLVDLDVPFSKLFPAHCTELIVQRPSYARFCYFFVPFVIVTIACYIWRRSYWPINARSGPLIYAFVFFVFLCLGLFMDYEIYGTSARCEILVIASVMAGPLFFMPLALRAFRLSFLYRWNLHKTQMAKEKRLKSDWYFENLWMLSPKTTVLVMIVNSLICLILAVSIIFTNSHIRGVLLDTGYCSWFYFTPEVIAFANQTLDGTVGPSILNPWGYGPYSPNLATCEICHMNIETISLVLIWNFLYILLIIVFMLILRNINDQYWLWREIMLICAANVCLFPFAIISVIPSARAALNIEHNDFIGKVVVIVVTWDYSCSIILPLILSFTRHAVTRRGQGSSRRREISSLGPTSASVSGIVHVDPLKDERTKKKWMMEVDANGKVNVSMDLDDVIEDPAGLQALRQFSVESFKAEIIEFYIRAKAYRKMRREEAMQQEASNIYHLFIKDGALLQINISYQQRLKYDKLCHEGYFNHQTFENSMTSSNLGTGGVSQMKPDPKPINVPGTPQQEGGGIRHLPSSPSITLHHQDSETALVDRAASSTVYENDSAALRKDETNEDMKAETDKLVVGTPSTPESDKIFRAVDFTEPLKEVRQLIYDDWFRFHQSKHWLAFVQDLQSRVQAESKEDENEQGLTELQPTEEPKANESSRGGDISPDSPRAALDNVHFDVSGGGSSPPGGRSSRIVTSASTSVSVTSPQHPDAA